MLNSIIRLRDTDSKTEYPIYFKDRNLCLECGGKDCLELINVYGDKQSSDIHAYKEIVCSKCNAKFTIKWEPDENGDMKPYAVGNETKLEFIKNV